MLKQSAGHGRTYYATLVTFRIYSNLKYRSELYKYATNTRMILEHKKVGAAIMAFDQFSGIITATGMYESGLGRWCWLLIKGRYGQITRIITAYQLY